MPSQPTYGWGGRPTVTLVGGDRVAWTGLEPGWIGGPGGAGPARFQVSSDLQSHYAVAKELRRQGDATGSLL